MNKSTKSIERSVSRTQLLYNIDYLQLNNNSVLSKHFQNHLGCEEERRTTDKTKMCLYELVTSKCFSQ